MLVVWVPFPTLVIRVHFPMLVVWVHFPILVVWVHFPTLVVRVHFPTPAITLFLPKSINQIYYLFEVTALLYQITYYIINVSTERHFALQNKYLNVDLLDCELFAVNFTPQ